MATDNELLLAGATAVVAGVVSHVVIAQVLQRASARLSDVPNERSSHRIPTPRGGGLGIAAAGLLGWAIWAGVPGAPARWGWVGVSAAAIAAIGFADDLVSLSAKKRLLMQLGCSLFAVLCLGHFESVALPGAQLRLGVAGSVLTMIWIAGLTNAFNFMDGIDGIAGTQGFVAALGCGAYGWLSGQPWVVGLCAALVGASIAFLRLNWQPARIFMGDVGSTFFGYALAVLPLALGAGAAHAERLPAFALLLVWPFVFDAGFTFLRRALRGENVLAAHRSHIYQRLVISGLRHSSVSLLYGMLATLCTLAAVLLGVHGSWGAACVMFLAVPTGLLGVVTRRERVTRAASAQITRTP